MSSAAVRALDRHARIALSGWDSSLIAAVASRLVRRPRYRAAEYIPQTTSPNVRRLARLRSADRRLDAPNTRVAEAVQWALLLDGVAHCRSSVAPPGATRGPLLLGRWAACWLACMRRFGAPTAAHEALLRRIPPADVTIRLDGARSPRAPLMDDETRAFDAMSWPIVRVVASPDADATAAAVDQALATAVTPRPATAVRHGTAAARGARAFPNVVDVQALLTKTRRVPVRKRAKLVALCGLDGAGKSTVLARLREDRRFSSLRGVAKRFRDNVDAVVWAYAESAITPRAYLAGPFATAIRWAHAFDFLRFYDEEVVPHLADDGVIVSDRWSACSVTYAESGVGLGASIDALLSCVVDPDVVVYLDVAPELAVRRIRARGDQKDNESVELLRACAVAYERWLPRLASRVVRIRNDDLSAAYAQVAAVVERLERP